MMHEKKSQSNNVMLLIILLVTAIFAYIGLKTKGFGYLNKLFEEILNPYVNLLENIAILLIVFIITYLFIKATSKVIKRYLEKRGRTKKNVKLLLTVYKYFIWVFAAFITLSLLFKQIGSLITSLGLIGFGLTLALQKPILNFVGWLTIIFGKSYQIGDIISINNITGKVYDIKAMYTNLGELNQDGDATGKSISIPNEYVLTTPVVNFTKGTNYIWDTIAVYITYKSDWKKALKIIEKIVQDYYDKNIKSEIKKIFRDKFEDYEKVITRVNLYEKGIIIKIRYAVDFDKSNDIKTELSKKILEQLKDYKTIILGKTENV